MLAPWPQLVIVLILRPEQLYLVVYYRETFALIMVVNLRGYKQYAPVLISLVTDKPA